VPVSSVQRLFHWGQGGIALFARAASGDLICQQKGSAGWAVPASRGVPVAQTEGAEVTVPVGWHLAACADAVEPNRIDLVANSPDGDLLHLATTVEGSRTFGCLGAPAVAPANRAIPFGLPVRQWVVARRQIVSTCSRWQRMVKYCTPFVMLMAGVHLIRLVSRRPISVGMSGGCQVLKRLPLAPVERLAWPCSVGVPDATCC
jgi:hypothetical protein